MMLTQKLTMNSPARIDTLPDPDMADLPIFSNWLINISRFKSKQFDPTFIHRPDLKMADFHEISREKSISNSGCSEGKFCNVPKSPFTYLAADDPAISVRKEFMNKNLPKIYLEEGETDLDFTHTPRKPCQSKARYIALIKEKSLVC